MSSNNDNDFALVRNKSHEIDMELGGTDLDTHLISLRHWMVSFMDGCTIPQTTEEWNDYFLDKMVNAFVVRDGKAYSLLADYHLPPNGWSVDEFDRTYVMACIDNKTGSYWIY